VSDFIIHVTDETFEQDVLKSSKPVLVDYWADWCRPCLRLASVLEDIAIEYQDRIQVAKFNIDENPKITARYGIRSIPTLILFKAGEVEARKVGGLERPQLSAFIDSNL